MSITPIGRFVTDRARQGDAGCDEQLAEWNGMDNDLGAWLASRAVQLGSTNGVHREFGSAYAGLAPDVWRALVMIWSTSPVARARYSPESRAGLFTAAQSMDDALLLGLVAGLIAEASDHPGPSLAAAA